MSKVYKIHPGIGIARVGDSAEAFFIGPEVPGQTGVLSTPRGEQPIEHYKDASGRILRQAARFRVYEYEKTADGALRLLREITADDAEITWHVRLANRKAASRGFNSESPRNPGVAAEQLVRYRAPGRGHARLSGAAPDAVLQAGYPAHPGPGEQLALGGPVGPVEQHPARLGCAVSPG